MEMQRLYRGRLIDHIQLVVRDLEASKRFYQAAFAVLNIPMSGETPDSFWYDELLVSTRGSAAALGQLTGRMHLAFQAVDPQMVDRFHAATLQAGGRDLGAPGYRSHYHPDYYAAFVEDPDGNNIEAVFHGPAQRSATAVEINF